MNDKEMIEKIRATFVGEDYIDLAIQHYHNCRRNAIGVGYAYLSVLQFTSNDVEWFYNPTRDDIEKISVKSSQRRIRVEVTFELINKWSIKITKWPDGYEVISKRPDGKISTSECGLSFEKARELVEGWEYETSNS